MSNWYNEYPKRKNAIELCNKILVLTSDPPEDTNYGGMKTVIVKDKKTNKKYKIMVTEQDLSEAIQLYVYSGDAAFTFQPSEKNPEKYASVAPIPKEGK